METTYSQQLTELKKYRKILYRVFVDKKSGDRFQLVMFTLEYSTGALMATMTLCSHTNYKLSIPMRAFRAAFDAESEETKGIFDNVDAQ